MNDKIHPDDYTTSERRYHNEAVEEERRAKVTEAVVDSKIAQHRKNCKTECPAMLELKIKYENIIPSLECGITEVKASVVKIYEKMDKMTFWVVTASITFIGSLLLFIIGFVISTMSSHSSSHVPLP